MVWHAGNFSEILSLDGGDMLIKARALGESGAVVFRGKTHIDASNILAAVRTGARVPQERREVDWGGKGNRTSDREAPNKCEKRVRSYALRRSTETDRVTMESVAPTNSAARWTTEASHSPVHRRCRMPARSLPFHNAIQLRRVPPSRSTPLFSSTTTRVVVRSPGRANCT